MKSAAEGPIGHCVAPTPSAPVRHVLITFKELGPDPTCTDANPYRGRLGEIAVAN